MKRPQPIQFSLAALLMMVPLFALYCAWLRLPPVPAAILATVLTALISVSGPIAFWAMSVATYMHNKLMSRKDDSSKRDKLAQR